MIWTTRWKYFRSTFTGPAFSLSDATFFSKTGLTDFGREQNILQIGQIFPVFLGEPRADEIASLPLCGSV